LCPIHAISSPKNRFRTADVGLRSGK